MHLRRRAFLEGETGVLRTHSQSGGHFWLRDYLCAVLENFLQQAIMAARPYSQDEIIPATEWGMHLEASIYFPFTL